ncbi:MAG: ABC transporter permease, partial [Bacillota bacterium]
PEADSFNELVFTIKPGADYELIEERLKEKLQSLGLISIFPRSQQDSHFLLNMELTALTAVSKAIPIMFLLIAAMILYITLKRLIEQQRGQIGILKAEGYTEREILVHYLSYAFMIGLLGGVLGIGLGSLVSYPLTSLYQIFFNLPYLTGSFSFSLLIKGILLSLAFSLFAGYQGCKRVLSLEPAEAMRPPAPIQGKKVFLEKARPIWKALTIQGKMAFRNLSRSRGRNLFIFLGIILCFAISGFTTSINDLFQRMVFDQYEKVEVYDLKMTLASPLRQKPVQRELESFTGIYQVEPLAEIPATLNNQWHAEDLIILGIQNGSSLYNILDYQYNQVPLPREGILLSQRLADLLKASPGDYLTVDSPFSKNSAKPEIRVSGIIPQYIGVNAYMELGALQNLLQQAEIATSFLIKISPDRVGPLQEKYLYSEQILSIDERTQRLNNVIDLLSSFSYIIYYYVLVGVILGFVIIYSATSITIAERQRELASMLVLGMTPKEVLSVVTIEQWVLALPAMLIGIPTSKIMMASIAQTLNNDLFSMPSQISTTALVSSFLVTSISILIAQKAASKKINKIKMTEVLGSRE